MTADHIPPVPPLRGDETADEIRAHTTAVSASITRITVPGPKPLVYVAGPITGNPWGCVRQATDAFTVLRAIGCVPFLPQLSVLHEMVEPRGYDEWLAYDHDVITCCDALVRLPGVSPGADAEVAWATRGGLPIFTFDHALDAPESEHQIDDLNDWADSFGAAEWT